MIRSLVPFAHVQHVPTSIAFYEKLGFTTRKTVSHEGFTEPTWAWMESNQGHMMLGLANGPIDAGSQAVMFYLYTDDVVATLGEWESRGVPVGPIRQPFYAPFGEFRVEDPDGYVLMIMQTVP